MAAPHAAQAADVASYYESLPAPVFDLASEAPIWENVVRYAQYFFSVMLGTGYVMLRPFAGLLKNPISAVFLIVGVAGFGYFVQFTVKSMLGLEEPFEYVASSAVTNNPF